MVQRGRWGLSDSQKRDLWIQWRQGQPISEIARLKELVAETMLENRLLKKSVTGSDSLEDEA